MDARDVMTKTVVSVAPETPTRQVARLLLEKVISAVPVVDPDGAPLGMISEGDLIGRDVNAREARRDWWLEMLAEGDDLAKAFVDHVKAADRPVRDFMAAPVITVEEDTPVRVIAALLDAHRIKRVPVVREGRVVGIVSRADLVRALAQISGDTAGDSRATPVLERFMRSVDATFHRESSEIAAKSAPAEPQTFSAAEFRQSDEAFEHAKAIRHAETRRAVAEASSRKVKELLGEHVAEGPWREMLMAAHDAACRGETEHLLLRFPSQLCTDGGRKINVPEADWPSTLRGEASELYLRWEHELRPRGFGIAARLLDFPGGMPGDVGLYLTWGV
jgi:CBS domain-containing protein